MKSWHMLLCVALIAAGVVFVASGASGLAVVALLGCALMMGAMVWMMMRGGGSG